MLKKVLFYALLIGSMNVAFCQVENQATLNYSFYAPSNGHHIGNIDQSNIDFNYFLQSRKILKKIKWDNSFAYRTVFLDGALQPNLQDLEYRSNFVYTKNMKNFLIGNVRFNMRSELQDNISSRSIFPTVSFGYMRQSQTNKAIRWGLGVTYNNDFDRNTVLPFLLFNYENAKYKFNATLPNSVLFLVKQKPTFFYGVNATLNAAIFELQNENSAYLKTINANVFGFIQTKIHNKLWLDFKPGFTILRTVDLLNADFKAPSSQFENQLTNNFVLNVGLMYRM